MHLESIKRDLIRARISPAEKRTLVEASRARGLTLSEYLRQAAFEAACKVAA